MKEKILEAIKDMNQKVKFVSKPRHYETLDGVWLQGVSVVSSVIPKEWLSAWGAKEAVKFLGYSDYEGDVIRAIDMQKKIASCTTPEEYIAILKEAKGASGRKSKTALIDGKVGHSWLESYVKAKIENKPLPEIPTGMLERPIKQWLEWEKNVKEWILSEELVAYPQKGYAGTLDGMALMNDNKIALIDFKFASHISEDYYLQTAGYSACFEPYGIKLDGRIIIRLPKTLEIETYDEKTHKYSMIPNNIEIEPVSTDYEFDRNTFLNMLPVKKWINIMEKRKENK